MPTVAQILASMNGGDAAVEEPPADVIPEQDTLSGLFGFGDSPKLPEPGEMFAGNADDHPPDPEPQSEAVVDTSAGEGAVSEVPFDVPAEVTGETVATEQAEPESAMEPVPEPALAPAAFKPLPAARQAQDQGQFIKKITSEYAAIRYRQQAWGARKKVDADQKSEAARLFDATTESLSMSKRLISKDDPEFKAVRQALRTACGYWAMNSIPFPEDGIRLLKRSKLKLFKARMEEFRTELQEAVVKLNEKLPAIRAERMQALGRMFDDADYVGPLNFDFTWYPVNTAAPEYLKQLDPAMHAEAEARLEQMIAESVRKHEQERAEQLHTMALKLMERLRTSNKSGKPKTISAKSIEAAESFFAEMEADDAVNNPVLLQALNEARAALHGVDAGAFKGDEGQRTSTANAMESVTKILEASLVTRPTRAIDLSDDEEDGDAEVDLA